MTNAETRTRLSWAVLWVATAIALSLALSSPLLTARAFASEPAPTVVLVHGAWADPGSWDETVARLRADGYATATPRLALLGLDGDVAIVRAALDAISGSKILVGHSYGGFVISNAAYGRGDVLALVYTAAFVPDAGDTIIGLGAGFKPSAVLEHLAWTGTPFASLAFIERDAFPSVFAGDLSPKKAEALNEGQQPTSPAILFTPSAPVAWHALPSWYAVSGMDLVIDPAQQRAMAHRAGSTVVEFDDASHAGGFTHYVARFSKLIRDAVAATAD